MPHGLENKKKIKHLHERYLRLIQIKKLSSYEELPEQVGSVSVHHRNIRSPARDTFF